MKKENLKKPIGVIECIHDGCIKAKLLNFDPINYLYVYPRKDIGLKIYIASCYIPVENANRLKEMFNNWIMKNELYKNIDSMQYFQNAIGFNIVVYSITNTDEEKNKLSLFHALSIIFPTSSEFKIRLVYVYRHPNTSENIERVFLEVRSLRFLIFRKIIGRLKRLRVYKIKSPKNSADFKQDRRSLYEQQDDPLSRFCRWKQLFKEFKDEEGLSSDERDILRFYYSFLDGKTDILMREKRRTIEVADATKNILKKFREGKSLSLLPVELNKIYFWILELSKNKIPTELKRYGWKASDLFEFYIYKLFSESLALDSRPWGQNETRFKEFSDGYFFIPRENIVCLFDTKASKKGYKKNEVLKFANYVKKHKADLFAIKRSEIRYFAVISSEFHINFKDQTSEFFDIAGVKLVFLRTEDLVDFTSKLRRLSEQKSFLETVKWGYLLSKSDPCLTKRIFEEELKRLKEAQELY